jgi:hypothetical protein
MWELQMGLKPKTLPRCSSCDIHRFSAHVILRDHETIQSERELHLHSSVGKGCLFMI